MLQIRTDSGNALSLQPGENYLQLRVQLTKFAHCIEMRSSPILPERNLGTQSLEIGWICAIGLNKISVIKKPLLTSIRQRAPVRLQHHHLALVLGLRVARNLELAFPLRYLRLRLRLVAHDRKVSLAQVGRHVDQTVAGVHQARHAVLPAQIHHNLRPVDIYPFQFLPIWREVKVDVGRHVKHAIDALERGLDAGRLADVPHERDDLARRGGVIWKGGSTY